jgi:anti-anti-sigma regulatory factor
VRYVASSDGSTGDQVGPAVRGSVEERHEDDYVRVRLRHGVSLEGWTDQIWPAGGEVSLAASRGATDGPSYQGPEGPVYGLRAARVNTSDIESVELLAGKLTISISPRDDGLSVLCRGELTGGTCKKLRRVLNTCLRARPDSVHLDCTQLHEADERGIKALADSMSLAVQVQANMRIELNSGVRRQQQQHSERLLDLIVREGLQRAGTSATKSSAPVTVHIEGDKVLLIGP